MVEHITNHLPTDLIPPDKTNKGSSPDIPPSHLQAIKDLPGSIGVILQDFQDFTQEAPEITKDQRQASWQASKNIDTAVIVASMPQLPMLIPTWRLLTDELNKGIDTFPQNFQRTLGALLVTRTLLHQTTRPAEKRLAIENYRGRSRELKIEAVRLIHRELDRNAYEGGQMASIDSPARMLPIAAGYICEVLEQKVNALNEKRADDEETAIARVRLANTFGTILFEDHPTYRFLQPLLDPKTKTWLHDNLIYPIMPANIAKQLLLNKKLEDVNVAIRIGLWQIAWPPTLDISASTNRELADYFSAHPDLQESFWSTVADPHLDFSLNNDDRQNLGILHLTKVRPEYAVVAWFCLQKEEGMRDFFKILDRYPEANQSGLSALLSRLSGMAGIFKTSFPDHPSNTVLSESLQNIVKLAENPGSFSQILSVLRDETPGAMYLNLDLGGRIRIPKLGETKEAFLARQKQLPGEVVYVSQAPWPETAPLPTNHQEQPAISFTEIASQNIKPWGEVQFLAAEDTARLLHHLGTKARVLGLSEDHLLNLAATYGQNTYPAKTDIVLPDLLPPRHPLISLQNLGVIGMDWTNGNMRFLLESTKADLAIPDLKKVLIAGRFDSQGELVVEGQPDDFAYSPLHLLLQATALWAKTGVSSAVLTKEEVLRLHQLQKGWNQTAKRMDLPLLDLPENQSNGGLVRIPLDKKTAYLSFKA